MAAAEARAAWQRTANRCFVQEDAKRAPKLACCSSSSAKVQSAGDAPSGPKHPVSNFLPLNLNSRNSNLPSDIKWWLQVQPNFLCQEDFTHEQVCALEAELEGLRDRVEVPISEFSAESHDKLSKKESPASMPEAGVPSCKAVNVMHQQPLNNKIGVGEFCYHSKHITDEEPIDILFSNPHDKGDSNMEISWKDDKVEPWWRTADKDELASLVAQKSLEHIENCDLPRPQNVNFRRVPSTDYEIFHSDRRLSSSLDHKLSCRFCKTNDSSSIRPDSRSMDRKVLSCYGTAYPHDGSENTSSTVTHKDPVESKLPADSDSCKAQLLEALRHSQTRAREAEAAARQAYSEKEHIVKLFLRQASQLFAYKQWLHILQLEALYLQLKTKDHQISTLFPVLQWMPSKTDRRKAGRQGVKRKAEVHSYELGKYAVAFAVGLSLAGAGLLLGWTLGWLFPGL